LKVLRAEFLASVVQRRFEIEAELLAQLHHPGIAQIYAAHPGDPATPPFIAMELVDGPPITEYVDSRRLSIRERIELMARACDAVQHAHQRGIIHRDLKPGNILVNADGQPKVLDFGVARASGARVSLTTIETESGQLVGTLAYMSPEQVEAAPDAIDTRTDIHALGVILFRLLTGRLPFAHDDPPMPELARRIAHDNPPRLSAFAPELRGDLEIIVSRALAKEKDRRYPSAAGLAADLRRYLAEQPISASADSAWYLLRRELRRYRLAFGLSAAGLVALAGLASYANLQRVRANDVNLQLERQLATSTIDRGRLISLSGNLPIAEELVWRELFRHPESRHAQWTLWDIYSREPSLWLKLVHEGGTQTVRFSPDNRRLATAGRVDGLIRLLDVETGRVIRTLTARPKSGARRVFFTADGAVVSGSEDGLVRVWDSETGAVRREISTAASGLQDLAISVDGVRAFTAAAGGVQVWTLANGQLAADFAGIVDKVLCVAADPGGSVLIAGSDDGSVAALDVARRVLRWRVRGHDGQVISAAVDPHGRVAASGGVDGFIHLWNISTGERLRTIRSENGRVRNLAFFEDGSELAAAGLWRTRSWSLDEPTLPPTDLGGSEGITDLHVRPDGRFLATCNGGTGQVRLWDLAADARIDHWAGHRGAVTGLVLDADGRTVVTAGTDGLIAGWRTGRTTRVTESQPGAAINGLAISGNGRWLASVGRPGAAAIWDRGGGDRVVDLPGVGNARAVVFANDDRRLYVGEADGTLDVWDWSTRGLQNGQQLHGTDTEVLALLARGSRLIVAHRNRSIVIRDAANGREIRRLQSSSSPFSLAVSPDGRLLAAGTWLGNVDLWEFDSGRKLEQFKGQTALVMGLDFSPDGRLLAVASRDGSTRLWDVASAQWLATVALRKRGAEHVRFLPDGNHLAIGYEDGEIEIRDLQYFFRYAAGHAEYQLGLFQGTGEFFPRSSEVLEWSRRILAMPSGGSN
jgi:WD40 repeat protein